MVKSTALAAAAASILLSSPVSAGLYLKTSPVLQVEGKNYDSLIAKSNHTSIVEFYAPWCGHCQNLKPAYEKAAKNLAGLAKVAAVNCDEETNKPLCGQMGVKGFPTLKIVRPGKKAGKPTVEDYQGARSAKAIVDAVVDKIPNHVKRLQDKNLQEWLGDANETAKAILFTDKGTVSALLRAVAIDFLGSVSVAQIRNTQKEAVSTFGVKTFPTLILLPGGDKEGIVYDGEVKKDGFVEFLSQVAEPNPDPAPKASKKSGTKPKKADPKKASDFSSASSKHSASDAADPSETIVAEPGATDGTDPNIKPETDAPPVKIEETGPPLLEMLENAPALEEHCLQPKSFTCILALLPETSANAALSEDAQKALANLAVVQHKIAQATGGKGNFPFYSVPSLNTAGQMLRRELELPAAAEKTTSIIAINAKRGWFRKYTPGDDAFSEASLAEFIDTVKMGGISGRGRIPDGVVPEETKAEDAEPPKAEQAPPVQVVLEDAKEEDEPAKPVEAENPGDANTPEHGEL